MKKTLVATLLALSFFVANADAATRSQKVGNTTFHRGDIQGKSIKTGPVTTFRGSVGGKETTCRTITVGNYSRTECY